MSSRKHRPHVALSTPRFGEVVIIRQGVNALDPRVRRRAMQLAVGDVRRIDVVSPTEAVVRNRERGT